MMQGYRVHRKLLLLRLGFAQRLLKFIICAEQSLVEVMCSVRHRKRLVSEALIFLP
jgi:hypothetical protein